MNDFLSVFVNYLNQELGLNARIGYVDEDDSVCVANLPSGKVIETYMDNRKLMRLPYEIVIRDKLQEQANMLLWMIDDFLKIETLTFTSETDSFEFDSLSIDDKPYLSGMDERGNYVCSFSFHADLII